MLELISIPTQFISSKAEGSDITVLGELLNSVETDNVPRTLVFYKQQYKFISVRLNWSENKDKSRYHCQIRSALSSSSYIQEELSKVKKTRETQEQSLREKERNEHVYVGEIAALKQEIRRQIRNSSRESANLEYLKNIVLR